MASSTQAGRTVVDEPGPARSSSRVVRESISRTTTPAFSCLSDGTVLNWNSGAELLFGVGAAKARRRKCYQILAGQDIFGNDYCSRHCPVREMACRDRPVQPFRMSVRSASGDRLIVRALVMVLGGGGREPEIVHLFDPLPPPSPSPGVQTS